MLGSSKMYSTPTRPAPICVASRMRCASPPLNVPLSRFSVISKPDVFQKAEPGADFLDDLAGDLPMKFRQLKAREKIVRGLDRKSADLHDRKPGNYRTQWRTGLGFPVFRGRLLRYWKLDLEAGACRRTAQGHR